MIDSKFQEKALEIVKQMAQREDLKELSKGSDADMAYELCKDYIQMDKADFQRQYAAIMQQVEPLMKEAQGIEELSLDALDMVAGGSLSSFFHSVGNAFSSAGHYIEDHAKEIVTGAALVATAGISGGVSAFTGFVMAMPKYDDSQFKNMTPEQAKTLANAFEAMNS